MPSAGDYDQLGGGVFRIRNMGWRAEVIRARYGGGYFDQANVGPTHGLHRWGIVAGVLPDSALNLPTVAGSPWFTYLYEFYKSHTTAEVPFRIAWNGKTWTAIFSNLELSMEHFRDGLYSTGIQIEQCKIRGFTSYAADGSIA